MGLFLSTNAYAGKGMLKIVSEPGEAKVYVNGKRKGSTPSQRGQTFAIKLSEGEYTITAKKEARKGGYGGNYVAQKEVFIGEDTFQTITLKLDNFVLTDKEKQRKIADEERVKQERLRIEKRRKKALARKKELINITDKYRSSSNHLKDFVPKVNGVILDKKTGLEWMRCSLGQRWTGSTCKGKAKEYTWEEAKKLCSKTGWRLPNIWELETLVYCSSGQDGGRDEDRFLNACKGKYQKPTISQNAFLNTKDSWYWTSTTVKSYPDGAWRVNFYYGYDYWDGKTNRLSVRCVR